MSILNCLFASGPYPLPTWWAPAGGRTFEKVRSKLLMRHEVPRWPEGPFGKVFGPTFLQKGGTEARYNVNYITFSMIAKS